MKINLLLYAVGIFIILGQELNSQTIISGKVTDAYGKPVAGANIYIKDSYDGTTSANDGSFKFEAWDEGKAVLLVSILSFKTYSQELVLEGKPLKIEVALEEEASRTEAVTVSAGAFEAGDAKKAVILNSLDIVSIAGAGADIMAAMSTLPGANLSGGNTGLYVRGGSGREAVTIIDGLEVPHPYYSNVPDVSSRGRFSPFLFQGTYFSSGGYSAEYGQGMSSALILNSIDLPEQSFTSISLMTIGADLGHTERWENTSLGMNASYYNLQPAEYFSDMTMEWDKAPIGGEAAMTFRHKTSETGMLKSYSIFSHGSASVYIVDADAPDGKSIFDNENNNFFNNITYKEVLGKDWMLFSALSYTYNRDANKNEYADFTAMDNVLQGKVKFSKLIGDLSGINFGGEYRKYDYDNGYNEYKMSYDENFAAAFVESDLYLNKDIVVRAGARGEFSEMVDEWNLAPRLSFAYKTGENSQFSLAYGQFYQKPPIDYLHNGALNDYEKASHYIANFQSLGDKQTFRIEAFYKNYDNLIKTIPDTNLNGKGDAKGIDIFWRDKGLFEYSDYWISYSYTDTEREYLDYPVMAMPDYATKHNLNIVFKYFIPAVSTSFGITYNYASGRPYYNPNNNDFLSDMTDDYHKLSFSASYITALFGSFTVIYLSVDNILGRNNVFSYRYSADGTRRYAVTATETRSVFFGFFTSFGRDNTEDL